MPKLERRYLFAPHRAEVVDPEGGEYERKIRAIATTGRIDRHNSILDTNGMLEPRGPLPLLLHHDATRPVGAIEEIETFNDKIEFAAAITDEPTWRQIVDGTLAGVSVGFLVHDSRGADPVVITRWQLVECSLVAAPSNTDAVILSARSAPETPIMPETETENPPAVVRTVEALPTQPRLVSSQPLSRPALRRSVAPYSLSKVIAHVVEGGVLDGIEREITDELTRRSGSAPGHGGIKVPAALFTYAMRQTSTDPGSAQALTRPEEYLVGLLDDTSAAVRFGSVLQRLSILRVTSSQETVSVPKRVQTLSASMMGKDAVAPDAGALAFGEDRLMPKYGAGWSQIRRSALKFTNPQVDQLAIRDLGEAIDELVDDQCLFGSGLTVNVKGLLIEPASVLDLGGEPATSNDILLLKATFQERWKIDDESSLRWLMSHRSYDSLTLTSIKQIPAETGEWFRGVIPASTMEGFLFNIPVVRSGKVLPTALGPPATYRIDLVRPDLLLVVFFGSHLDLVIDPYSDARSGAVNLNAFIDFNAISRDPQSHYALTNVSSVAPQSGGPPRGLTQPPASPPPAPPADPPPPAPEGEAAPAPHGRYGSRART